MTADTAIVIHSLNDVRKRMIGVGVGFGAYQALAWVLTVGVPPEVSTQASQA
jgi:hypothetical protein